MNEKKGEEVNMLEKTLQSPSSLQLSSQHLTQMEYSKTDEGWSWLVAVAAGFGTLFVGMSYTLFTLMYQDMADTLDANVAITGWIGSLHVGCGNLFAIFVSRLIEKCGCRFVCMLGSILTSLGYMLSYFAPHVVYMCLSFGVLAGISTGMVVTASIVVSLQYFSKKRTIAGGLVAGGFSLGSVLGGLLMRFVNYFYPWQFGLVIYACIMMQMTVISAFAFRPFIPNPINLQYHHHHHRCSYQLHSHPQTSDDGEDGVNNKIAFKTSGDDDDGDYDVLVVSDSTKSPPSPLVKPSQTKDFISNNYNNITDKNHNDNIKVNITNNNSSIEQNGSPSNSIKFTLDNKIDNHHNNTFHHNDNINHNLSNNKIMSDTTAFLELPPPATTTTSTTLPTPPSTTTTTTNPKKRHHSLPIFPAHLTTIQLFTRLFLFPPLTLYLFSNLFIHVGMTTFLQHSPKRALGFGIKPHLVAMWPVYTALMHGFSKIACGLIANAFEWDNLVVFTVMSLLTGVCQVMIPLCVTYEDIIAQAVVESFFLGCYLSVLSTVLVDLVGIEHVAKSQGLLALFVGIASTLSTPFSGFMFDVTGNYDVTFIVSGVAYLIGSSLCAGAIIYRRNRRRQQIS